MNKVKIYLDDTRIPTSDWIHVSSYDEFINEINKHDIENIELISFDHDLGDKAIEEFLIRYTKMKILFLTMII